MGAGGGEEMVPWERAEESLEVASEFGGGGKMEKIVVSVRLRPLSEKEVAENDPSDWECINDTTVIFRESLLERSINPTAYTFGVFAAFTIAFLFPCSLHPIHLQNELEMIFHSVNEIGILTSTIRFFSGVCFC